MTKLRTCTAFVAVSVVWLLLSGFVYAGRLAEAKHNSEIFTESSDDPYTLAVQAYVWGYPLVRAAQLRLITTLPDTPYMIRLSDVPGGPLNHIGHQRTLSTPNTRLGVAPNHDTLYSLAWLDLAEEPFVLEAPDFRDRYYVFQMGQADSSTDHSFGQRTHGPQLPPVFIYSSSFDGDVPADMLGVKSKYRYLMIAGRIFVNGDADLPAVHDLQDQVKLQPYSAYREGINSEVSVPDQQPLSDTVAAENSEFRFLGELGSVLRYVELTPAEESMVDAFQKIGLSAEDGFSISRLNDTDRAAVAKGIADGKAVVRSKTYRLGHEVNGWSINYIGPHFETDYLLRAAVAMDQIYIVEPKEALYPSARVDTDAEVLDGKHSYRIRFGKGELPPVNAFWSVTMYHAAGFMVENAIDRWSIGDRTPGLVYDEDGALEIIIQHEDPNNALSANWLPAPNGPFMLLMRLYLPKNEALDRSWLPPPVSKSTDINAAHPAVQTP